MIKKIAVIGTGVIGSGWIVRFLAHNKKVIAYDKDIRLKKKIIKEIKRTWPYVRKLFNKKKLKLKNFKYVTSIQEALKEAEDNSFKRSLQRSSKRTSKTNPKRTLDTLKAKPPSVRALCLDNSF